LSPELTIKTKPGAEKGAVSVVVGKSTLKKATERNLLRRRIKSILSPYAAESKVSIVVIVKKIQKETNFSDLKEKILSLIDKTKK
jgi:ribonuclease P protein component